MQLISHGDRLQTGRYEIHSRFRHAVNFTDGGSLACLADESTGSGPFHLIIRGLDTTNVQSLRIDGPMAFIDGASLTLDPALSYRSLIDVGPDIGSDVVNGNVKKFWESLLSAASEKSLAHVLDRVKKRRAAATFEQHLTERFEKATAHILQGRLADGAAMFKGTGYGLTPAGDDFNTGLLLSLNIIQKLERADHSDTIAAVYRAAIGTNLISNASLTCARDGRTFEKMKRAVESVLHGDGEGRFLSVKELLNVGETSGADMGTGFYFGMKNLLGSAQWR